MRRWIIAVERIPLTAQTIEVLDELIADFQDLSEADRLELLLEFSDNLPEPPERYAGHEDQMEQVTERSEEHTSELQSRGHLVCRLLLEKKKKRTNAEP